MTLTRTPVDPVQAFDLRCDARDARNLSRLTAQGYVRARCPACGATRPLDWAGWACNEGTDDGVCGAVLRAEGVTA